MNDARQFISQYLDDLYSPYRSYICYITHYSFFFLQFTNGTFLKNRQERTQR